MDKAKEWLTTLTAHLPEWCAEWIPDVDQWQWQQWHPADLWQWARTREWRVPELPRWGEDGTLVPEWIFPSYWRKRVREAVLWVWLIFITFLAAREEQTQREVEGSQLENDSGAAAHADDQRQKVPSVPEEGEEEEDDEETGAWRGGLERPGGLTRYPGIENLLAQPPTATPPPPRHRPPPPVTATQVSNKQILLKPDETQSRKNESREGGSEEPGEKNHQDEVWKTLLAKYGTEECVRETDKAAEEDDEEEVPEYVGTAEEIVERYSAKFEEPRQDMSPEEEFSAKVGRRLEEYLQRLDEDDEESSQAKEVEQKTKEVEQTEKEVEETGDAAETEEARDIEDGGERLEGITSNGNENRIFIVIEDEESEDDRRNLNDISEGSEISQALETQDAELKDEGQLEEEIKELSSQQNGLSCEAEPQEEVVMETVPEASGKVDDREEIVEHAADTVQPETPHDAAEGMKAELKDDTINMTEEQLSDATLEEKGKETKEEYTKEVVEKTPETATTYVAEDQTEESIKLSSGEEVKLEEDAEITSIEPPKEQDEMAEQESTKQTSPQPPEEVKQEEVQTLAAAEEGSERHDNVSEDVIMKEQDSIESEALATRHETQEETTEEDKVVEEEEEEKYKQIKEDETIKDEGKETLEIKVATDVSVEENKVVEEQETANKDAREDEKVLETEVFVKLPEDVKKEAVEEEKKHQVEAGVTEDEERELPTDKAAEVAATEPPAAVEEIQVDEETHFEDGKAEESKDEAMVVEEHMEDEEVPVASVEGWTQDVWGTLGQAPGEAAPLVPPASIDMMEEDTEDVMEVDVEEEVGETMEEDLEVFVDDVDLRELPESPVPLPTVPEEEDHLAEVQDLLVRPPPRKHRRRHRQEEEHADTKGMSEAAAVADPSLAKYMTMPPALSPEEEEELRKYLAESGDAKDLSVDKFMSMPTELTEQEQKELEEAVRERERVRQAESAGLDRFLNMPVGLTEQEIHELKDLEREKEEAAVQPWERGDVGFEDYLSMPHTLTEEEERMLQEGEEDEEERQFASEEEYREYVKNKFLSQLEEDALRMAEEDYDYDEDYDDDYEYEDDEEYEDEEEVEDEDEGEMEGEYVMVSDLAAASNLPQAAAASTATVPAATAPAAATATPAKMVDEAVNTELNDPKEDAKSKKKPFPFPKKSDRETTPEDSNSAAQKKFFHFGSLGTKRKKETPDFLDKKYLGNPNGRKFDGGGGGGSLSAAFCTVGDQVTRAVLQKVKGQIRQGKATKEVGLRKDFAGVSESGGVGSPKTSRGFTRLYLKPDQSDSGAGDEETPLSNPAEHLNSKNELEHVFAKIIKSYKSPNYQTTQGSKPNHSDNVTKSEMNEAKRTLDATEQTQEEDATRVFIKDAEKDLMSSPILDIIMEEEEEEMDAEVALVFTHEREVAKAGGDEEDFWLRWSNEERACVSAARDCCSPWQLAEGADTDREDNEEAVRWSEEKEGSSQTGVKVTVNNEENDKTNRNEEEKDEEVMGRKYKQETIREKKAEETQRGSAMANVETTDAAVSNAQLEADSLEFGVNTNLSVMDDSASLKGASPSLQELIEAELNVRLCQPDSLEPPSPDPSSLLSCDSIEPTPPTLIPALTPAKAPTTATPTGLTLDSLLDLDSLQDPAGMADTESGIDVLSPTKLDDLSTLDMDSLESSSDLPGSSHCSPEPTVTLTTRVSTVEEKGTHLTIAEAGDPLLPSKKCASSLEAEGVLLALREDDSDAASLGDLQVAPPLLRISESSLTIASETRSELSQVSQEVTRSSTPDSLTSFEGGSAPQDSTALQDNDVPQEITQDSDVLESLLLQNSVVPDSDSMQGTVEVQEIVTLSHTVDTQHDEESSSLLDSVSPSDRKVSQEDRVDLLPSVPQQEVIVTQDSASPLEASLQQDKHTEAVAPGDLAPEETNFLTSPESSETPAEPSHLLPAHDPASPSSPQSQDRSSPSPSPAGALPLNGTNSVCDGDLSNSARDDCGDVGVSSGRVDTTTQAVSSSDGGGGGVGVSGPVTSLQNGSNMESQVEDEDDFWGSKNDDDDIFVPRHRFDPVQCDQEENDTEAKEEQKAEQMEQEEEEEEEGNNFFGSDDDDKGAKGLRFKKRTTTTTRTENGIGGIEKKKEVVEQVEKKKQIEESGGKKIEVTTEKKKVEVREERKKADIKEEKKKEVEEEKKKEAIEEEDKENGVAEDGGEKKKKKKKHRDSEDGERLRKKKKKKRDSEKENKKAAYQKRDDILEKHVGPRVRSFDAAKMKSKFEKPKQVSQVSSECRQCGKQVFQMEKIVAEKAAWHKNCFRCKECNCILTLETYQSHEGVLYCKPHFKELFRPKVVVEDPDEARKERLLRRPKLIVLESQPQELAEGVVRSTNKPDYGLEDLSHANLKQKFKMFEQISTEEERVPDPIPVRRSQSLLTKAARFMQSDDDYGIENSELGEYDEDEEDEDYEEDEEEDGEEGEEGEDGKLNKKSRAASFSGMKDLKAGFARKNRQDELTKKRRQELAKFRQMLCAGKNISTREIFEGGNEDEKGQLRRKEQIKIEGQIDAKNLRERFEKGLSVVESDSEESGDRREVDRVFKEAETASKARNLFKQIDKTVAEGGEVVLRPASSAQARRENRLSRDGIDMEELELGRDPNLVKCTDNYEDEVDCRGTRKLLAKFKKMEKQAEIIDKEGEEDYDSDEEYSDEEYSDEEEEDSEEEDSEEEDSEEEDGKPKYKDEVLEMLSAKKAASLRAKFEKWESEVERNNEYNQSIERYEDEDECMPSIDTARNLRAMFENKAQESTQPVGQRPKVKVNRFVGGGGDKCMLCDHTVYAMERLEVAGRVLHKNCFKCCKCSTKLSMNTFSIGGDDMYCTTHYKQAFTEKGTYDVFTPNKGKWTRKIEATNSESSKSQE